MDHYTIIRDFQVGGANEKDILEDPATGDWYIAKLGKRHSDLEVLTEYMIYLVGRHVGARVADARIATFHGRLRFLSKYFLDRDNDEELVHGIQLFRALYDDAEVDAVVGDQSREQAMFSLQQIQAAFGAHYVDYGSQTEADLFRALVEMVTHDAIIGVQDRHHENWGVIVRRGRSGPPPRFAPLYDSARGLFGSIPDSGLAKYLSAPGFRKHRAAYAARSRPLMGWDGLVPVSGRRYVTHHQLVAAVYRDRPSMRSVIRAMLDRFEWQALQREMLQQVGVLCSGQRITLILSLLRERIRLINATLPRT